MASKQDLLRQARVATALRFLDESQGLLLHSYGDKVRSRGMPREFYTERI